MFKRLIKWLSKGLLNIIWYITIAIFFSPALLYYISNHNGYYPYEFLNNLSHSIILSTLLGGGISMLASEFLTEPEYDNYSITRDEYKTDFGTAPYWIKVKYQFSRKLDLTDEELASNAYIRDFFSISIFPIGIYYLLTNNPANATNFPENNWIEAGWILFIHYIATPLVICIVFSIILFLILNYLNQSNTERIWSKIKKWITIMWNILLGNMVAMTIWFWLVKLEFYKLFGF